MAAPSKSGPSEMDPTGVNPNVNFLYKTMLERDPRKRKVKPVADSLVQLNFGGLDSDSEEDSDFEIDCHGEDQSNSEDDAGSASNGSEGDRTDSDNSGASDADNIGEDDDKTKVVEVGEGDKDKEGSGRNNGEKEEGLDVEEEDEDEYDLDETDDESEEMSGEEEEDEEDCGDEENGDEAESTPKAGSSGRKGLEEMLNMIDSDEDDEDYVPRKKKKKSTPASGKSSQVTKSKVGSKKSKKSVLMEMAKPATEYDVTEGHDTTAPQNRIKVMVCCVCLSDRSADEDELVECDNCGISVHEGCYGISESHSAASTESSASTEPWFCDACKASAKPVCELCPNTGGIFKETDNGRWVHIVCALYTPGVAFGDVDRLSMVTLFEMPYSKWGARECSLCEDSRFSHTGVCINCDAGMCKAYFHVTCAQREGLLAEVTPEDVMEVADPFFAYCKLHADKMTSKMKRRNWLAIQSHVKTRTPNLLDDGAERARFQRKLQHHIDKYSVAKGRKPPSWVPDHKLVRHLHTSPSAVRGFLRKAEMMGIITQAQSAPLESQEMRKKTQGQPAFTADFITFFMERNMKLENMKAASTELSIQNKTLQHQERLVRRTYDKLASEVNDLKQKGAALRKEGEQLCDLLQEILGKPVPGIPEMFKPKKRTRSPSKKESSTNQISELIQQCGICNKTTDQHLLVKCDSCKKYYHLGCLNPPLTRMPKKTKLFGWQCQFCALSSSDGSVKNDPDPDQPRKLRETIKEPDKFFHLSHVQESLNPQRNKRLNQKRNRQRKKIAQAKKAQQLKQKEITSPDTKRKSSSPTKPKPKKSSLSPSKSPAGSGGGSVASQHASPAKSSTSSHMKSVEPASIPEIMCCVCNGFGSPEDTIRCDECMLYYHLACLDPPVKKSPKVRGYAWHCEACDMIESSDEDEDGRRRASKQHKFLQPKVKTDNTRPSGREGRQASNSIMFDIDVSSDEVDGK